MEQLKASHGCVGFGVFEADLVARELRKNGVRVKLQDQPFQVLTILLQRAGEVIPREELRQEVWTADTFVDFDNGLNTAINKIREVLGDSADNPRFVQTLPRRGYRFIAPIDGFAKPSSPTSRRLNVAVVAAAGSAALVVIAGLYLSMTRRPAPAPPALAVTRLTNRGTLASAAISADGKYLAYVIAEGNQQSLRILQVGTASDLQLLSPADAEYRSVTFSPDSNYIYYARGDSNASSVLYRIPMLGGVPGRLIEDVHSPAGISPDGKRLAFVRYDAPSSTQVIVTANPDGSGEYRVTTAKYPEEEFYEAPVWSPDGKALAIWQRKNLVAVPVSGGPTKTIASNWIHMPSSPAWLADGSGLIVAAAPSNQSSNHSQLWRISYPEGKATPILADPYRYGEVSLTRDLHTIVAEQIDERSSVWVAEARDPDRARPVIQIGVHYIGGAGGVTWTPDGQLLYSSSAKANFEFWMMNPDGTSARLLPLDPGPKGFPSVCPDGRTVVFHTPRDHHVVVRADLEGGRSQVLADGLFPRCSPDGEWVLFKSEDGLRKVPIKGGEPILLSNFPCALFDIAPNGQHIACLYHPGHTGLWKLAIISPSGGRPVKLLDLPDKVQLWPGIRWTPDGEAVGLVVSGRGGDGNVWIQPIAGGQARQVTHFTSGGAKTFGWSRDGRYLAFSRSAETVDAVMITNFR